MQPSVVQNQPVFHRPPLHPNVMPRPTTHRSLRIERLAERCPLAAEGSPFTLADLPSVTGLIGDVEVRVDYGDGSDPVSVGFVDEPAGKMSFRFDYSLDDPAVGGSGFFHGANQDRRQLLDLAGRSLSRHLDDSFAAVPADDQLRWNMVLANPSPGAERVMLPGVPIAANEILVYVGARPYGGNQVAEAGFGFAGVTVQPGTTLTQQQFDQYVDLVRNRGQYVGQDGSPTETSVLAATIGFDSQNDWSFEIDPAAAAGTPGGTGTHFLSVATHELLHVLGFGHRFANYQTPWDTLSDAEQFNGPRSVAANGNQPLRLDPGGHLSRDTLADGATPLSAATLLSVNNIVGTAHLTDVELTMLGELGYDVLRADVTNILSNERLSHVYADEGIYAGEIQLVSGSGIHRSIFESQITNVPPAVAIPFVSPIAAGDATGPLSFEISDPGFADDESFTYEISWGDDTIITGGPELLVRRGQPGTPTTATLIAEHQYAAAGNYQVDITVLDNDGGRIVEIFDIVVLPTVPVFNPFDVNLSNSVTALDALIIINAINQNDGPIEFASLIDVTDSLRRLDVTGDMKVTPLDALRVINNLPPPGEAMAPVPLAQPQFAGEVSAKMEDDVDRVFALVDRASLF